MSRTRPPWLETYAKWTARTTVVAIAFLVPLSLALVPLRSYRRTWPLPRHFAYRHGIADLEILVLWIAVGIGALVLVSMGLERLLRRAGWPRWLR